MSTLARIRRLPLVAFTIALAALLAACGGPEIPLNGTIIDAYTGKPVPAATINLGGAQLSTDAGGKYQVVQWSEKDTLQIAANGYEPISIVLAQQPQLAKPTPPAMTLDAKLRPNTITGAITDAYSGKPLAGALVKASDTLSASTGADGKYRLTGVPANATVQFGADGYAELTQPLEKMTTLDAVLRPDVLKGTLVDSATGKPIKNATVMSMPTLESDAVATKRIDNSTDGAFQLDGLPEQGFIQVLAPGYRKAVIEVKPGSVPSTIKLEPFFTKSLYVTAAVASNHDLLMKFFDTIDKTELNAIVIDLKSDLRDDLGLVYYDSQVPIVKELKASRPYMDLPAILAEAKKRGIYTIARVHIFSHDNVLAEARPEWAAKDRSTGGVFADYPGPGIHYDWLDPWNRNVWDYNIQLAVEAAHMGFDEINYDYIRFPSLEFGAGDKDRLKLSKPDATSEEKYANIVEMLTQSQAAINGAGAYLSVDVFGVAAWEPSNLIAQDIGRMGEHTDYVCPMIYPSHFWNGALDFDLPAQHPYEIILDSMQKGAKQMVGKRALLRPWLQDFTLTWVPKDQIVEYGPNEVRAQIKAVEDFGQAGGWMLYDSANQYTVEALKPK